MTKEEKQVRNSKVVKLYVDNNYDIDTTTKIVESIPELAKTFTGKSIRRSCMGILQSMGQWKKLEKPVTAKAEQDITKKELLEVFCRLTDTAASDYPTMLNLRKIELANLIMHVNDIVQDNYTLDDEDFKAVSEFIEKKEKE